MYENKYPEVDDVVVVQVRAVVCCPLSCQHSAPSWPTLRAWALQVTKIAEMGAYVSLLEYNGIEGMILLSELSRRRIRSINKLIKARREGRGPQAWLAAMGVGAVQLTAPPVCRVLHAHRWGG